METKEIRIPILCYISFSGTLKILERRMEIINLLIIAICTMQDKKVDENINYEMIKACFHLGSDFISPLNERKK